jgi:hypothetical protein
MIPKKTRHRLPWPLEHTDAAVHRHLSDLKDLTNEQLTFKREQVTQSSVVYRLSYPDQYPNADSLGRFELFRRPDAHTAIEITGPSEPPTRPFNEKEEAVLDGIPPRGEEYERQVARIVVGIDQERKDAHRRSIARQESFMSQLFARLGYDAALPEWESSPAEEIAGSLPKSQKTREKWKQVYRIWLKMLDEYRKEYELGNTDDPKPSIADLRDRLLDDLDLKYSVRRLRTIVRAGEADLLR